MTKRPYALVPVPAQSLVYSMSLNVQGSHQVLLFDTLS